MAPSSESSAKPSIAKLRLIVERARVDAARQEMMLLIREREEEIARVMVSVKVQENRLVELDGLINKQEEGQ